MWARSALIPYRDKEMNGENCNTMLSYTQTFYNIQRTIHGTHRLLLNIRDDGWLLLICGWDQGLKCGRHFVYAHLIFFIIFPLFYRYFYIFYHLLEVFFNVFMNFDQFLIFYIKISLIFPNISQYIHKIKLPIYKPIFSSWGEIESLLINVILYYYLVCQNNKIWNRKHIL